MSNLNNTTAAALVAGQKVIFKPSNSRAWNAPAGTEATVGPKGVFFDHGETRYVDIIWPAGLSQSNGGYHVSDFVAKDEKPVEPTAPMTKAVLDLMRRKGAITQMEAQGVLRCRALPRRIADLKDLGHKIVREMKVDPTGQRYARYHLQAAA